MEEPLMSREASQRFPEEVSQDVDLELNARDRVLSPHSGQKANCFNFNFRDMVWALLIGIAEIMGFIGTIVPL